MERKVKASKRNKFDPSKSIKRARRSKRAAQTWSITIPGRKYEWSTKLDRVAIIREGLPYGTIEVFSRRSNIPIGKVLQFLGIPQTTYNKRKRTNDLLKGRDSELILVLTELLDYGLEVFNNEAEKFDRWRTRPNLSLGGATPESLFDSLTGIQEVKNSLNRIEYGNMA